MPRVGPFDVTTQPGETVTVDNVQLTPIVRVVRLRHLESMASAAQQRLGGFAVVMATPVAIRVNHDQDEESLPVPDPTRQALLGMLSVAVLVTLFSLLIARPFSRRS